MALFNRIVKVLVGVEGKEEALSVEELRVTFKATKSVKSSSNTCTITIYNLSESSRNKLSVAHASMILMGGYVEDAGLGILFIGDVTKYSHVPSGTEWVSTVSFNDGAKALKKSTASVSFAAGKSVKDVISNVASSFGKPIKFLTGEGGAEQFAQGFADAGQSTAIMNVICAKAGYEWSIQNGEIIVTKKGSPISGTILELSPGTGLIGSPEKVEDTGTSGLQGVAKPGWKVKCLLLPSAEAGGVVSIKGSKNVKDGSYRIESVEHSGDTHGTEFNTELLLTAL